jgi:CelD/BcsL family acetyltransferase involved in cellulose biosynthesis
MNENTRMIQNETYRAEHKGEYTIRVIEDIHDPDLVHHWKRIEDETDCFPQMYYEWCEPWWRLQSGNRKLHIVAVEEGNHKIVGIAPLCVEKRFGLSVLRSFPIHFGDFYSFLVQEDGQSCEIIEAIVDYVRTYSAWELFHLFNVNSKSELWGTLQNKDFLARKVTDIIAANFAGLSFNEFMKTLSYRSRKEFGKNIRKLEQDGKVTLECVRDSSGYTTNENMLRRLYDARWADDHLLPLDNIYYQCRNEAIKACYSKGKVALFLLKLDGRIIAFELGFLYGQIFYGWKVSHDPDYNFYSPGALIIGKIIEELISMKFTQFNFMTGDYSYKRSWAPGEAESANYELFACGRSVRARLYFKYRLEWRDKLRKFYHTLLDIRWVRLLKRWTQGQRRRLNS